MAVETATVRLWGTSIGAVALEDGGPYAVFQYDPGFTQSGIELSPVTMPLREAPYTFPSLPRESFHGLPGLLADALPDRYGTQVVDAWLARQGRDPSSFSVIERLCYQGTRGMGALEFLPSHAPRLEPRTAIDLEALVELAGSVLSERVGLKTTLAPGREAEALDEILAVGTSAGGARAKAVVAWNPQTGELRSGQIAAPDGFEQWLIKFDGVARNGDHGLVDPQGFGSIEFAYSRMAAAAGITMSDCRLLEEGGRRHFMTRRFDRTDGGDKLHAQTLGGLAHFDYNAAGAYGYEQAFLVMKRLGLPAADREEQLRRMVFNVVARNQDDHVKNISFLMDRSGTWSLSPAYDITYGYDPTNRWMAQHQMSINGKRDGFTLADLRAVGAGANVARGTIERVIREVTGAVRDWPRFAAEARVPEADAERIGKTHRLALPVG